MKKTGTILVILLWAALTAGAWFLPKQAQSEAERRPLAQAPAFNAETVLGGSFMTDFEKFTLDQFPLRDSFRTWKALVHYGPFLQMDNNGIYVADGMAVKQEFPLDPESVDHAVDRLTYLYEKYLAGTDVRIYQTVVPDKGYYLAEGSGHLTMDYEALFEAMETGLPWATFIDLTDSLDADDYYRTDTHWRQESLLPAAQALAGAMGVTGPQEGEFTPVTLDRPFYGVYYGQAALPLQPEDLVILESDWLKDCTVLDYETGKTGTVYDMGKLESKDLYDVFLSGSKSLLTIENPHAATDRELVVFRDSFGSSMVPLLVKDYAKVTLVDIRYIQIDILGNFIQFDDQDVLLLYSTLVLNNSETIK